MVVDSTVYKINENFRAFHSEADSAGLIGRQFNYPKLYVSHISDEYFEKLLEVESVTRFNNDKCLFILWDSSPGWRDKETKLTFKWLHDEDENAIEVYRKFGCEIAEKVKG